MAFTSVEAVAAHYPGFDRSVANQVPSNADIQDAIERQGERLATLVLVRGYATDDLATSNPQAYALLSLACEVGVAADMGEVLWSMVGSES